MAIFVDIRPELRRNLLSVIVGVSLFLTACSTVGVGMQNTPPLPVFTSTPGSAATQDATYTYQIATTPAAGNVTLALANAPSGTTLNGTTLAWTPTAAQSRMADQFSVKATNAAGSATQSWTVTPAGTVSGTWIDTNWTPSGPVLMPFDFTKVPIPPTVLVPQAYGSFLTVDGTGKSDGTFSIPNIPGGYYWLHPVPRDSYWTSSSTFDFGADLNFQQLKSTPTVTTTTLSINFSGLDPLQTHDELLFLSFPSLPFFGIFDASSPVGATSLSEGARISSNIDFSQVDTGFMLQYEPETFGALSALGLGSEATVSNLALRNGAVNTISGTLTHSTQVSFDLNVKGSAWAPLFENVGPGSATLLGSDLSVITHAFANGTNLLTSFGLDVPLLFDPQPGPIPLSLLSCPDSSPTSTTGFLVPSPGEPAVTADQDFGLVKYGDPFPSTWPRVFTFCQTFSVSVPIPGSTSPIGFNLVDRQSIPLPTSEISPLVSQLQNPIINGSSLFAANTVAPTGVTLSWTAPTGATPTGYKIDTFIADASPKGFLSYIPAGTFYTAKTSATLPPLQAGKTYVFLISAILDGAANFETSPNRSALPTASASVVSAPITIGTGP
jgi:hypothetical protein